MVTIYPTCGGSSYRESPRQPVVLPPRHCLHEIGRRRAGVSVPLLERRPRCEPRRKRAGVLVAEIETGTRYRATAYATETDYGVVLADRVVWLPIDMLGEHFGRLTDAQRDRVVNQIVAPCCGAASRRFGLPSSSAPGCYADGLDGRLSAAPATPAVRGLQLRAVTSAEPPSRRRLPVPGIRCVRCEPSTCRSVVLQSAPGTSTTWCRSPPGAA
jgi:hypothetical protein